MKASQILFLVSFVWFFNLLADPINEGPMKPDWRISTRSIVKPVLEEPLRGFEKIMVFEFDQSVTNRFHPMRYLDRLKHDKSLDEFASHEMRSAMRDAVGDALREYFIEDPNTSLPVVQYFLERVESLTSGKFARFVLKTFAGEVEDNQLVSPFEYSARGLPLQERDFVNHKINFGLRPVSENNPRAFLGYTARLGDLELVAVQLSVALRGWEALVPEFVVKAPLINDWSLGLGARYRSERSLQFDEYDGSDHYQTNEKGFSYFVGLQGYLLGGYLFVGTGYPELMTVVYSVRF